ncbi:MAG TPA: T9SS type A sorting domain-containing protein [Bacteroidia bacterium]|nr:T9SS type A sorting domain-containing protein [Bacteroidia bacterium]
MKKITLLLFCLLAFVISYSQNCSNTSTGYIPINDLGTGNFQGAMGGLYPNGSNFIPSAHMSAGLNIANNIQPLDTNGNVDAANGWIVWASIGMSNTTQETQVFIPMTDTFAQKNPKCKLVDCAQGGQAIVQILDTTGIFWPTVNTRLANAGVRASQVQVVWFKEAEMGPNDTAFATYPDALKNKFKQAMQLCKTKFPNLKLCYLSSRIYAGYATTALNPEPYAYYSGWSVKRLIEEQVNGDTALTYTGTNPRSAWLAWGPYLWADGLIPRSDGLTWLCPADFNTDGTHPSNAGRQKVANMLFNFFSTDSTSTPWFLINASVGINERENVLSGIFVYPNPVNNEFRISSRLNRDRVGNIEVFDLFGRKISGVQDETVIDVSHLSPGIYFVIVRGEKGEQIAKFVKY